MFFFRNISNFNIFPFPSDIPRKPLTIPKNTVSKQIPKLCRTAVAKNPRVLFHFKWKFEWDSIFNKSQTGKLFFPKPLFWMCFCAKHHLLFCYSILNRFCGCEGNTGISRSFQGIRDCESELKLDRILFLMFREVSKGLN